MKHFVILLTSLLFINNALAQDFNSKISSFSEVLKTVKSNKKEFTQSIEEIAPGVINITITETDTKGKSITKTYELNPTDINKNAVSKVVKKDLIYIQIKAKNRQKLIKQSVNNEKNNYIDNFKIYAADINNARELESVFKELIPLAKEITKERVQLSSYEELFNWLENNVGEVDLQKKQISQSFKESTAFIGSVNFKKNVATEKSTEKTQYDFNLFSIKPKSVKFKISGESISVYFETKKSRKTIKQFESDNFKKFTNKVTISCANVEQARDLKKVLKDLIPLSKKAFNNTLKHVSTVSEGISKLNSLIGSIKLSEKNIEQNFKGDCIIDFKLTIDSDKSETHDYSFSFSDIDKKKVNFGSKEDYLFIDLFTKGGEPFIKHIGDDNKSSYIKTLKLYASSIENTVILKHTLIDIIKLCGGDTEKTEAEPSDDTVDTSEVNEEETVADNCKPNKSTKQANGDFLDLYGGRIRSGGFGSNDKSVYSLYIGQIDGGKKGTTIICVLNEPVKSKHEYNNAVNNFLNENNLKTSVLELTLNGKTLRIPATACKQQPTKFLGDINGYFVTFEGDILKDQIKMIQDYDLQRFRLIVGGHPYERFFKKPTKRTKDLKQFFNCVQMNNIFEIKKKDATKMDLSEVSNANFSTAINGKWLMQGTNGSVTTFNNGKITLSKMGVKRNEGSYKIVGKRIIITTNNGNSISEINMFLTDMLILKEKGVEKTYERID